MVLSIILIGILAKNAIEATASFQPCAQAYYLYATINKAGPERQPEVGPA
jgi:hypothetical protein